MVDQDAIARAWSNRGFSCGLFTDPPGRCWEDFVHDVDELLLPVEGELEVEVAGTAWRPAVGEEVFIPAHAVHSVRNVGATTSRWLYGYRRA